MEVAKTAEISKYLVVASLEGLCSRVGNILSTVPVTTMATVVTTVSVLPALICGT